MRTPIEVANIDRAGIAGAVNTGADITGADITGPWTDRLDHDRLGGMGTPAMPPAPEDSHVPTRGERLLADLVEGRDAPEPPAPMREAPQEEVRVEYNLD